MNSRLFYAVDGRPGSSGCGRIARFRACAGRAWPSVAVSLMMALAAGCSQVRPPNDDELARGYVLLLPGVESEGLYLPSMVAGLRDGGVDQAIDVDLWGERPFSNLRNLTAYEANRKEAGRLAEKLVAYRNDHPNSPITIVGYSGGGGMALFTAEALPADFALERVVLIGAAVSPRYDLAPTIRRCRRGMVSFYSELDWLQLGAGTEAFGTMDRQKTASAGYIGFENDNGQTLVRSGLEQAAWRSAWRRLGHGGDHLGWTARPWVRDVLAPQVRLENAAPASQPAR